MLAFYYPCRLDTIIITTSLDSCLSWSAAPLLISHTKAVLLLGFQLMYIPFTSPHYNRTLAVRPIVWEWYIGNSKTSYRCLYIIYPSYQASSFATGRGSPYCLRCRQPVRISQDAQAAFSDLRRRCCLTAALPVHSNSKAFQYAYNCDLSIAAVQFSFNSSKLVLRDTPAYIIFLLSN